MLTIYSDRPTMRKWRMSYVLDEDDTLLYSSRIFHECLRWAYDQGHCRVRLEAPEYQAILQIDVLGPEPGVLTTEKRVDGRNPLPDPE